MSVYNPRPSPKRKKNPNENVGSAPQLVWNYSTETDENFDMLFDRISAGTHILGVLFYSYSYISLV